MERFKEVSRSYSTDVDLATQIKNLKKVYSGGLYRLEIYEETVSENVFVIIVWRIVL